MDASDPSSLTPTSLVGGSGIWYDVSGYGNNVQLVGATYNTANSGNFSVGFASGTAGYSISVSVCGAGVVQSQTRDDCGRLD